ncbi:MAG: hypothetical protein ABR976_16420 [Terracidiphilus sp.]|jgi:hypothetical protein
MKFIQQSFGILLAGCVCGCAAFAQSASTPAVAPVVAELSADMFAHRLQVGATVSAKVVVDWKGPGCTLPAGSIVRAHVTAVTAHSKASKESEVALSFDEAGCGKSALKPYSLIMVVVSAPFEDPDAMETAMPRSIAGGLRSETSDDAQAAHDLRYWELLRPDLQSGQVYGIGDLSISVGPTNTSVLKSKKHDVMVFQHSQILLVPSSEIVANGGKNAGTPQSQP